MLKKVAFLPVLPHPVTKHETVYTCLVNLSSIAATLKQDVLPFTCDEGVYHIVIDIYLHKPEMFSKLFPMLGGFHMAKAAFRCAGKFLRGSGIEDGLIKTGAFGPKVLELVLGGSHYIRSFKGLCIIQETLIRLKWEAFWSAHNIEDFRADLLTY